MSYHIRVRPTALVIQDEQILLVEYSDSNGIHYNLPGGGAEPGETITDGVLRELYEETTISAVAGPIAFVYEYAPHHHSGNNTSNIHTLYIVLECCPQAGSVARLPDIPDPDQSAVRWIPLSQLDDIVLYPNIKQHIKKYARERKNIELIEDHQLARYYQEPYTTEVTSGDL